MTHGAANWRETARQGSQALKAAASGAEVRLSAGVAANRRKPRF